MAENFTWSDMTPEMEKQYREIFRVFGERMSESMKDVAFRSPEVQDMVLIPVITDLESTDDGGLCMVVTMGYMSKDYGTSVLTGEVKPQELYALEEPEKSQTLKC